MLAEVAVDDVDGDEQGLRQQVKFDLDYDQPIDQYFTLVSRYFPVKSQVVASWHENGLTLGHPYMNFVAIRQVFIRRQQALIMITQTAYQMTLHLLSLCLRTTCIPLRLL